MTRSPHAAVLKADVVVALVARRGRAGGRGQADASGPMHHASCTLMCACGGVAYHRDKLSHFLCNTIEISHESGCAENCCMAAGHNNELN